MNNVTINRRINASHNSTRCQSVLWGPIMAVAGGQPAPRLAALLLAMLLAGCHSDAGPPRAVVSGTVSYQGKLLEAGEIRFIPTKGAAGPVCIAPISGGKYRADHRGGAVVGAARVEIYGYRADPNDKASAEDLERPSVGGPRQAGPSLIQFLPLKYNTQSQLETVIEPGLHEINRDFTLSD